MKARNASRRTIQAYLYWTKYFIIFCVKQHPGKLDGADVERFLTFPAVDRKAAPGTQAVALNALVFMKATFLAQTLAPLEHVRKASRQRKLSVVLTIAEVKALLSQLTGVHYLMGALLYGSGLRRMEFVRLRVKDIDFDYRQIRVATGKVASTGS